MKVEELEVLAKRMQSKITALEKQTTILQDTEAIRKLQGAYGFYLEHWLYEDLIDLFADGEDSLLRIAAGTFQGKEAIARFFRNGNQGRLGPEFMHQVMQLQGVIDIDPDGNTAKGRWYGFGANAFPMPNGKVSPGWMNGVYEVKYVKEAGIWKMKVVRWCMTFHAPWGQSFVAPEKRQDVLMDKPFGKEPALKPTGNPEDSRYPSGFICPFHFANPVSGRKTNPEK
jgi:hypothetical protein